MGVHHGSVDSSVPTNLPSRLTIYAFLQSNFELYLSLSLNWEKDENNLFVWTILKKIKLTLVHFLHKKMKYPGCMLTNFHLVGFEPMTPWLRVFYRPWLQSLLNQRNESWHGIANLLSIIKVQKERGCGRQTAWWSPACCWPRWGSTSIGDPSKSH